MSKHASIPTDLVTLDEEIRQGLLDGRVSLLHAGRFTCPGKDHSIVNPFEGETVRAEEVTRIRRRCPRCRRNLDFILDHRGDTDGEKGVGYCLFLPGARLSKRTSDPGTRVVPTR